MVMAKVICRATLAKSFLQVMVIIISWRSKSGVIDTLENENLPRVGDYICKISDFLQNSYRSSTNKFFYGNMELCLRNLVKEVVVLATNL